VSKSAQWVHLLKGREVVAAHDSIVVPLVFCRKQWAVGFAQRTADGVVEKN